MVEHLKVLSSPLLSLLVEHLKVMAASRACLRILSMAALSVEHLKVQFTYPLSNK